MYVLFREGCAHRQAVSTQQHLESAERQFFETEYDTRRKSEAYYIFNPKTGEVTKYEAIRPAKPPFRRVPV